MKNKIDYYFSNIKNDLPAGLVVFLVALPLCLGIALASGAPLFSGIIAGFVGGIVVGALSGSPLGVSGPAAGLTVIVLGAIQSLGTFESFLLAVVLAGVIQIILGIVKAGIIGYYFPSSVIKGMLAAIGLILILKQIPHALGFDKDLMGDEAFLQTDGQNTFSEILNAIRYYSPGAIIISAISIAVLILFEMPFMKRISLFKFVPGALIVVILGIVLNNAFATINPDWVLKGEHLVFLPVANDVTHFFSFFTLPDFTAFSNPQVYVVAITIAIVASLETLLCVEATDKLDPDKRNTPTNRELFAQGAGNIASGLIGGIPLTQVIVRSSANINSGGKSKVSAIFHGILLLGCAIAIPGLLNMIPLACLAAILLVVGYKLSKISLYQQMFKLGWDQFIPFIVTIVAILFTDLLKGIGIGMAFSIFYILRANFRAPFFFNKDEMKKEDVVYINLSEEVSFLNKGSILLMLEKLEEDSSVVIDGSRSVYIDYDVLEIIQNFKEHGAKLKNIKLELKNIPEVSVSSGH
jgi:MFS superfamily sulfate permease-like transporter